LAQLPGEIQYTEATPSGRGPNVPLRIDVSTGAEYIARGMEQLGQGFLKVAEAKRAIDFSTKKREFEQKSFAFVNTHKTTGDPEARKALEEQWSKDVDSILTSDNPFLNVELTKYKNEVMPQWGQIVANQNLAVEAQQNKDAFETNLQHLKETGAVEEARKQIWNFQKTTNQISEAQSAQMDKDMPIDCILAQSRIDIGNNRPQEAINKLANPEFRKGLSGEQLDYADKLQRMAEQQSAINTDQIQNEIVFGMFENRDKTLVEKGNLGQQYITKLKTISGLSSEDARVMTNRVEGWMAGKERVNDSLVYTNLFRDVTQLHRGIGQADEIRKKIVNEFPNLDDQHFESLNKYLDETVEEWNADTLSRLEKESKIHLAPNLSMLEKFMEMPAGEQIKNKSLIDRLQEPAKIDANRLALYLDRCRKWIAANPKAPDLYENGRRIMAQFERYTDVQIRQMEKQLESGTLTEIKQKDQFGFEMGETRDKDGKNYKYIGNNQWQRF
jgi:hypothetical protein